MGDARSPASPRPSTRPILWARNPDVAARDQRPRTPTPPTSPASPSPGGSGPPPTSRRRSGDADVLIVGVPSDGFRGAIEDGRAVDPALDPGGQPDQGHRAGQLLRMTQIIEELLPGHPAAALTGPNLAREIMAGQAAASVIATDDLGVAAALQAVLRHKLFRVYRNHDVVGCEIGGALKNVIAIAAGIGEGLGVGDNTRAGGDHPGPGRADPAGRGHGRRGRRPSPGLAGMGDLVATCMSPYSRNRTVGELLGRGKPLDEILAEMHMVAEGVGTAALPGAGRALRRRAADLRGDPPGGHGRAIPADAYRGLQVEPGHESEPG